MEKIAFFYQKYWLTPLEKYDFGDVEKCCFYNQKKFLFYLEHH